MKPTPLRRGLSLLEVILGSAIFVAAMAVIGVLLDNGMLMLGQHERNTIGLLRCESKMEEVVAGIQSVGEALPAQPTPYEDDPRWRWTVVVEPTPVAGLLRAVVVVDYFEDPAAVGEDPDYRETLTRLIVDPAMLETRSEESAEVEGTITIPEMLGLPPGGRAP